MKDVGQDVGHLDQLPFIQPSDDLLDRLGCVLVLDDLTRCLRRRILELPALHARAVRADERGVDQLYNYVAELAAFGLELTKLRGRRDETKERRAT